VLSSEKSLDQGAHYTKCCTSEVLFLAFEQLEHSKGSTHCIQSPPPCKEEDWNGMDFKAHWAQMPSREEDRNQSNKSYGPPAKLKGKYINKYWKR
jgi:hypothetical protein